MSSPPVRDFAVSPASIKASSGTYLLSYNNAGCLMAIFDYLLIVFVTLASAHAYYYFVLSKSMPPFTTYFGIASIFAFIFIIVRYSQHGYYFSSLMQFRIITSVLPWVAGLFVCSMILFLFKSGAYFSRGSLAISAILGFIGLNIGRYFSAYLVNALVVSGKISAPRAVTIAAPRQFDHLSKTEVFQKWGVHELARFYLTEKNNELSTVDRALKFCRDNDIQCILLALEWTNSRQRERISTRLLSLPIPVLLIPDEYVGPLLARGVSRVGSDLAIELQRAPLSNAEMTIKRVIDACLASMILFLISPLLLLISMLIVLDSRGPIIFRQQRKGFNGQKFVIYKFRTMHVLEDDASVQQATRNDPRVTRIGRVLRTTSIDELPQLFNVICGQMSLVGPRPHPLALDDGCSQLIANYAFRQHVKPGLTGWAQIHGFRGETAKIELMEQRVRHDLWYVKNWSFWLDVQILSRTFFAMFRRENAY